MVLVTLLVSLTSSASHIMGGMISVAQTSQDSTAIALQIVTDPQGISPSTLYVQQWEMNSVGWYDYVGTIEVHSPITFQHQGYNILSYTSDYLNLDSNKYRFIATHCCWGVLNNAPNSNSSNIVISTDYWHIPNNSTPFMENPLWINVEKNKVNTMKPVWGIFNCFFSNPDWNDIVEITKTELYSGYFNGVFVPQTSQSTTNVLASNDSITFVGTNLGPVGYGFEIADYRNGSKIGVQRIQWTFKVVNSTVGIEENIIDRNTEYKVYDWYGRYLGNTLENQKGFLILRYINGKTEKIFCN